MMIYLFSRAVGAQKCNYVREKVGWGYPQLCPLPWGSKLLGILRRDQGIMWGLVDSLRMSPVHFVLQRDQL